MWEKKCWQRGSMARVYWIVPVAVLASAGSSNANAQQAAHQDAVNAVHEAYHVAFGNEDIEMLADIWLHDDSARLIVPPSDKVLTGWEQVRANFAEGFKVLDVVSLTATDVHTVVGDRIAWTVDVHHLEMRTREGKVIKPKFFSTHVYHQVNGDWRMVHHQASAPPDPRD